MRDQRLDGTPLSADDAAFIASGIGRIWKRYRRRSLDIELRDALASALLQVRLLLVPTGRLGPSAELDGSRYEIKNVAPLSRALASPHVGANAVVGRREPPWVCHLRHHLHRLQLCVALS